MKHFTCTMFLLCAAGMAACATEEGPAEDVGLTEVFAFDDRVAACQQDPRVIVGATTIDICVGADLFLREPFGGNGRSCASCHRVENNFTIDPAFISSLPVTDPLFIAEQRGDQFALDQLEIPSQMRRASLILENADGFAPDPTVRFVLRSVPHNLSMGTSITRPSNAPNQPPLDRTGWSGDGAPGNGELRDFQNGAIRQHYPRSLQRVVGRDFRFATDEELDAIDLFMRELGRTNNLNLANVVMTDVQARNGEAVFQAVGCDACHNNAGADLVGGGGNRNFNTGVETSRNPHLVRFPLDGGLGATPANADGSFGDKTFNTPPLVEAADTGPFFHTDTAISGASGAFDTPSADTIEQAIAFYDTPAFNNSPAAQPPGAPINLAATEIDDIGRFLRGINAAFNAAMARSRLDAEILLVNRFSNQHLALQQQMLRLAGEEVDDGIRVLQGQPNLNSNALTDLRNARRFIDNAILTTSSTTRRNDTTAARNLVAGVPAKIGTGLTFNIGQGTNMF